jgi:hypothetical protein
MTTIINAAPTQQAAKRDAGSSLGCLILVIGLIVFGAWFGINKGIEFAHGVLHNQEAIDAAEMQMLQESMNCLPGEMLQITPLGEHGAKSVRCIPGDNMPPVQQDRDASGGTRG